MEDHLRQGFVQQHTLTFEPYFGEIRIAGTIACRGRIVIMVQKFLSVLDDDTNPWVVTRYYSYQAFVAGHHGILRHDNAHSHPGHADQHHFHEIDWRTGDEQDPIWCGEAGWPNLSEFILKVAEWYDLHREELPEPEGVVESLEPYDERLRVL